MVRVQGEVTCSNMQEHDSPRHLTLGLPVKPGGHWQENEPGVLVHRALSPHCPDGLFPAEHSSTSRKTHIYTSK